MDECNINDGGLQHLGSTLEDHETITQVSIVDNVFSSQALTYFLERLCSVHSRLQILRLESQQYKPAHKSIVRRINNTYRPPLSQLVVIEFEKGFEELVVPGFFKAITALSKLL